MKTERVVITATTRALRVAISTKPDAARTGILEPDLPPYGDSLLAAESTLARARGLAGSGTAFAIKAWVGKLPILSFEGDPADSLAVLSRMVNRVRVARSAEVVVGEAAPVPKLDPSPARRLARQFLGLAPNGEALPSGQATELAKRTGWSPSYVSNLLDGTKPVTAAVREKLGRKAT